ncbi:hypothetical protein [Kineosporia sp. NBRC 101731]|uniref:hypothetical protein n=1 Tax=Kineosporia sp. NBRC 101731 TaxID=3032199 RepID=UPI0024A5DCFC|nr:hypothetical protein [Kineosporia sp. NBRC 101731]GLY32003.1 hypothetical protein Kisp02_53680 [Kineosporia sp. NBRC 101731]
MIREPGGPRFRRAAEMLRDDPWLVDETVSNSAAGNLDEAALLLDRALIGDVDERLSTVDWPMLWVVVRRVEREATVPA